MDFDKYKKLCILHSQTNEYKNKIKEANDMITKFLNNYNKPYVAFSGGKDSLVMLDLILKHKKDIMVLNWDYGKYYMPRYLQNEILGIAKKIGVINLRVETTEKYNIMKREAINILGEEYLNKLVKQLKNEGYDGVFVGLRKEESNKRKRRIDNNISYGMAECWIIQNFSWKDIWAYIFSNNLPFLSHYKKYSELQKLEDIRLCTFFDPEFEKLGTSNIDNFLMYKHKHL